MLILNDVGNYFWNDNETMMYKVLQIVKSEEVLLYLPPRANKSQQQNQIEVWTSYYNRNLKFAPVYDATMYKFKRHTFDNVRDLPNRPQQQTINESTNFTLEAATFVFQVSLITAIFHLIQHTTYSTSSRVYITAT